MTIKDFDKQLRGICKKMPNFLEDTAPRIAGQVAVKHAKENN